MIRWAEKGDKMKPYSAFYYVKQNKGRSALCILMMMLASFAFIAGNYIHSVYYSFHTTCEYSDKIVRVSIEAADEDYKDYKTFKERLDNDPEVDYVEWSARGYGAMQHNTVMNMEMGGYTFVCSSVDDLKKIFDHLGIEADLSHCKDRSIIISKDFARAKGIKLGDKLDHTFDSCFEETFTVDALIDDGGYDSFYICEDSQNQGRVHIFSDSMEGKELYDHVRNLIGDLKVQMTERYRDNLDPVFRPFYLIFGAVSILISVVLAVTISSVLTGQYLKRTYEYGVYRALGKSKGEVWKKVSSEILLMNLIASVIGFAVLLLATYLGNELYYKPKGIFLLYGSKFGLELFLLCDLLILIPLILSKSRLMSKADVTEF